jgi:large subunit ribosomal protein L21
LILQVGPGLEWHAPPDIHTIFEAAAQVSGLREVGVMYAVIRTGGKQYRVAPGDTLRIEKSAHDNGTLEFSEVLAVSGEAGKFEQKLGGAKVLAEVVGEGRGEKILVFHLKRKKQYKKMQGHRQSFVEVKINEIQVNGKSFKA